MWYVVDEKRYKALEYFFCLMGVSEDFERGTIENPNGDYDGLFFKILGKVLPPSIGIGEDSARVQAFLEAVKRADFGGIADYFEIKSARTYSFLHPATSALCFLKIDYACLKDYHSGLYVQKDTQREILVGRGIDGAVEEILNFMRKPDVKPVEIKSEAPRQKTLFSGQYAREYIRMRSIAGIDLIE